MTIGRLQNRRKILLLPWTMPDKEALETSLKNLDVLLIIFGVLVAIGVAGESIFGFLHFRKGNQLAAIQNAENLTLRERAANAEQDAAEAKKTAAQAGAGTAQALAQAAGANERAEKLEVEAATQRERAAKAEKELLELQQRMQPRAITAEQRARFIEVSRELPKGPVGLISVIGDGEGLAYAQQIAAMLNAAGWPNDGVAQGAFTGRPVGLSFRVRSAETAPLHAGALQRALEAIGLNIVGVNTPNFPEGQMELLVGNKQ